MSNETEREVAMNVLMDITNGGAYNNIALRRELSRPRAKALDNRQKGFVTEIVNGVLRNVIYVDFVINHVSNIKTGKMKPVILTILRMAAYQLIFMDKVPDYAVCNESVELAAKRGFKGLTGFVNGVIRAMIRSKNSIPFPDEQLDTIHYLSVMYSFPEWIISYWLKEFGYSTVKAICEESNTRPNVTICVNTLRTNREELEAILKGDNMAVSICDDAPDALFISDTSDLTESTAFQNGLFHIMDVSAMAAVKMLNPKPGSVVLDTCAAPGGKTFYCSSLMQNTGIIIACDIHDHKLYLMEESIKRLGIENVTLKSRDARDFDHDLKDSADCVIVDAPCSGLGLLRKKPDIKYTRTYEDIQSLVRLQKEILENTSRYVKKGGVLVYSTCTISQEENTGVIEWFTSTFPFEMVDILQLLPHSHGGDGFFIAKMIRER